MKATMQLHSLLVLTATVVATHCLTNVTSCTAQDQTEDSFAVTIRVDATQTKGPLRRIWRFFGGDEPNYAYMKDGRKLLRQLGELAPDDVFFRTHNLLTSGPGYPALKWGSTNAYSEDSDGNPVYDWKIVDLIFDTYRERGVRPYVQIRAVGSTPSWRKPRS